MNLDSAQKIKKNARQKFLLLKKAAVHKRGVKDYCFEKSIPRSSYYYWKKRAESNDKNPIKALDLGLKRRKITAILRSHYKAASEDVKNLVLDLVRENPSLSVSQLALRVPVRNGKPVIGHHGIQNLLKRRNLNTVTDRYMFSQKYLPAPTLLVAPAKYVESIAPSIRREFVTPNVLPAPPPVQLSSRIDFRKTFLISAFSSLFSCSLFIYLFFIADLFLNIRTAGQFVGMTFSAIALTFGLIFFIYSFKYYFLSAFVIFFSRKKDLSKFIGVRSGENYLYKDPSEIIVDRKPFVSIFVPIYNEKKVVNRLLEAVTSFNYENYEVIVCDDSTDETTSIVNEWKNHPRIKISHRDNRIGFKGAALQEAQQYMNPSSEFMLVFDADFLPFADTIEMFLKSFKASVGSLNPLEYQQSNIAVIQGYQWHVLNKSENWITRGVRTEYAGSYVVERLGAELYGGLKQIAGSVFMMRTDLFKSNLFSWSQSITEDFQLTLKLYEAGYKVIYTPYIQSPSECVSTLRRLIRQRMRWAEGHSYNIKKFFTTILLSNKLSISEKIEFLYLSPYYLQSALLLVGTISWFIGEFIFQAKLPFWTAIWGWSLVLTNLFSLPLMNLVGLFLEEAEQKDYGGIFSFIFLTYILTPFQAFAAFKGFMEVREGPWFRTPKTGLITDVYTRSRFYNWLNRFLGGISQANYASLSYSSIGRDLNYQKRSDKRSLRLAVRALTALLLIISLNIGYLAHSVNFQKTPGVNFAFGNEASSSAKIESTLDEKKPEVIVTTNAEPLPQDYFISFNSIYLIENGNKALPNNLDAENYQSIELSANDLNSFVEKKIGRKLTDSEKESGLIPYYMRETEDGYEIYIRSKHGLQRYTFSNDSVLLNLSQRSHDNSQFVSEVESEPVYEYQKEDGTWGSYINAVNSIEYEIEKYDEYFVLTQKYSVYNVDSDDFEVGAKTEFKLGYIDGEFINKLTFILGNNNNTNRLIWRTTNSTAKLTFDQIDASTSASTSAQKVEVGENSASPEEKKIIQDELTVDWNDFVPEEKGMELIYPEDAIFCTPEDVPIKPRPVIQNPEAPADLNEVIFYPDGIKGSLIVDPTLSFSTASNQMQVDVANRYRAIMNTNDTTDYLEFYDRAEDNTTPDKVFELRGFQIIDENVSYALNQNGTRKTTLVESSATRVKIRVEGYLETTAGGTFLTDGTNKVKVTEEYTFTVEGVNMSVAVDFRAGITIDATTTTDQIYTNEVFFNESVSAYSATVLYGDGQTESSTSTTNADINTTTDQYEVLQGTGNYQDTIIGEMVKNGDKIITNSTAASIFYGTTPSTIRFRDQATQTLIGPSEATFFIRMMAQADLDSEDEREGVFNDMVNPDQLTYTTGSEWNDISGKACALYFDGGDYVNVADQASLDLTSSLSIEAWINLRADTADYKEVLDKAVSAGDYSYFLDLDPSEQLGFGFQANDLYYTGASIPLNKWVHVAGVFDDSSDTFEIYINGVSVATETGVTQTPAANNADLKIGAGQTTPAIFFPGLIDEVRLWSTTRTAAQIRDNMFGQIDPGSSNLVGYWRMNECDGQNVDDGTSNNNNGILGASTASSTDDPTWTMGPVNDYFNRGEGAYTVGASGDQINVDIDAGSNVSTLLNGALTAGASTVTVDSTTGFAASGIAYIAGDKFTYTGTTATTFTGVATTGENSVIAHADNTVVSLSNRFDPVWKVKGYHASADPESVSLEGSTLTSGTHYNVSVKPTSGAYWAQDEMFYSSLQSSSAFTSPDIGTGGAASTATFVTGKYGNGMQVDASAEKPYIGANNLSGDAGVIEFWYRKTGTLVTNSTFFRNDDDISSTRLALFRGGADTTITASINGATNSWASMTINPFDGEWHHIRFAYDAATDVPDIWIDNVQQTRTTTAAWTSFTPYSKTYIGNRSDADRNVAGIIDEFVIYGTATTSVKEIAKGGDDSDSSEYLSDSTNDQTFNFAAVDSAGRGEYLYLGSDDQVTGYYIDLDTLGAGSSLNLDWEYWNGTAWTSLESITGFTDGTSNLTKDGAVYWTSTPTGWEPYSVNGSTDLYYIRASLNNTSGAYTTSPIENTIKTDVLVLQYLSDISSADQTLIIVPEYSLWLIPIMIGGLRKLKNRKRKKQLH